MRRALVRMPRFVLVGAICTVVQIVLFYQFRPLSPWPTLANAAAFVLSAQLNFMLSYRVTWHDTKRQVGYALGATMVKYNMSILMATGINAAAFLVFHRLFPGPDFVAIFCAITVSTVCTFLTNHLYVFRSERGVA